MFEDFKDIENSERYCTDHKIQQMFQEILTELVRKRPADPTLSLSRFFAAKTTSPISSITVTDVIGKCGGYNLTYAFVTGYLAGNAIPSYDNSPMTQNTLF